MRMVEAVCEKRFGTRASGALRLGIWLGVIAAWGCSAREAPSPPLSSRADTLSAAPAQASTIYSIFQDRTAVDGPSARMQHAFTFDAASGRSILFGGNAGGTDAADTWSYDGAWARCAENGCTGPSARSSAGFAFMPGFGVAILVGGFHLTDALCDTWEYNGATTSWAPRSIPETCAQGTGATAGRFGHAMAGFGNSVALFGGFVFDGAAYPPSNELLVWDSHNWSNLCDSACAQRSGRLPAARASATLTHVKSAKHDGLFLFGGRINASDYLNDLWEFDVAQSQWFERQSASEARADHGAVFDSTRGKLFVHGGCKTDPCGAELGAVEYDPELDQWSEIPRSITNGYPDKKQRLGIAFDATRRRIVEFGGFENGQFLNRTLEIHTRGGPCKTDAECHTGQCVNGICATRCAAGDPDDGSGPCVDGFRCDRACDAPCETCAATAGVCTTVTGVPDDKCSGTQSCNDAGLCRKALGQGCIASMDCASGNCPQYGSLVCSVPGCGTTPCMRANGTGHCTAAARGDAAECPLHLVCDDGGKCLDRCSADADCVPGHYCDSASGQCQVKRPPGEACDRPSQCDKGYCTDGVCCIEACNEPCRQCGAGGVCELRPKGEQPLAPRKACDGAGDCAGYCPGDGFDCRYPPVSTACELSNCTGDSCAATCAGDWRDGRVCDGQGQCIEAEPQPCGDYSCSDGKCFTECDDSTQCRGGAVCDKSGGRGTCTSEGTRCSSDGYHLELVSGKVVDCEGYRCLENGQCREICDPRVKNDCAPGYECQKERCVPGKPTAPPASTPSPADDGCSVSSSRRSSSSLPLLLLGLGWLLLRQRARARFP